jgi:hypothetical protein
MDGHWLEPFSKRRFHCDQIVKPALAPALSLMDYHKFEFYSTMFHVAVAGKYAGHITVRDELNSHVGKVA